MLSKQKLNIAFLLLSKFFSLAAYIMFIIIMINMLETISGFSQETSEWLSFTTRLTIPLTALLAGIIGDKYNRNNTIKTGLLLIFVCLLPLLLLPQVKILAGICVILFGIGAGIITPNMIIALGNSYQEKHNESNALKGFILFGITISLAIILGSKIAFPLSRNLDFTTVYIFCILFVSIAYAMFLLFEMNTVHTQNSGIPEETITKTNKVINKRILILTLFIIAPIFMLVMHVKNPTFRLACSGQTPMLYFNLVPNIGDFISILLSIAFYFVYKQIKNINQIKIINISLIGILAGLMGFIISFIIYSLQASQMSDLILPMAYCLLLLSSSIIYPLITFLIYKSAPKHRKGLFFGLYFLITETVFYLSAFTKSLFLSKGYLHFGLITLFLLTCLVAFYQLRRYHINTNKKVIDE